MRRFFHAMLVAGIAAASVPAGAQSGATIERVVVPAGSCFTLYSGPDATGEVVGSGCDETSLGSSVAARSVAVERPSLMYGSYGYGFDPYNSWDPYASYYYDPYSYYGYGSYYDPYSYGYYDPYYGYWDPYSYNSWDPYGADYYYFYYDSYSYGGYGSYGSPYDIYSFSGYDGYSYTLNVNGNGSGVSLTSGGPGQRAALCIRPLIGTILAGLGTWFVNKRMVIAVLACSADPTHALCSALAEHLIALASAMGGLQYAVTSFYNCMSGSQIASGALRELLLPPRWAFVPPTRIMAWDAAAGGGQSPVAFPLSPSGFPQPVRSRS